jgi:hypothetical protein
MFWLMSFLIALQYRSGGSGRHAASGRSTRRPSTYGVRCAVRRPAALRLPPLVCVVLANVLIFRLIGPWFPVTVANPIVRTTA